MGAGQSVPTSWAVDKTPLMKAISRYPSGVGHVLQDHGPAFEIVGISINVVLVLVYAYFACVPPIFLKDITEFTGNFIPTYVFRVVNAGIAVALIILPCGLYMARKSVEDVESSENVSSVCLNPAEQKYGQFADMNIRAACIIWKYKSVIMVVLAVAIGMGYFLQPEGPRFAACMLAWILVPTFFCIPQDAAVDLVVTVMTDASDVRVQQFINKVEDKENTWSKLQAEYMELRRQMSFWSSSKRDSVGLLLLSSLSLNGLFCFVGFLASVDNNLSEVWRILFAIIAGVSALQFKEKLGPLARITESCQGTDIKAHQKKILVSAEKRALKDEANEPRDLIGFTQFITHVRTFPTGVTLPTGVTVSNQLLTNLTRLVVFYGFTSVFMVLHQLHLIQAEKLNGSNVTFV